MSARTAVGDSPITVMRWRSTRPHKRSGFGKSGTPSKTTPVAPWTSAAVMAIGPINHPRSVSQKRRSSRPTSMQYAKSWAHLIRNPPWVSTVPLGRPVVPDV